MAPDVEPPSPSTTSALDFVVDSVDEPRVVHQWVVCALLHSGGSRRLTRRPWPCNDSDNDNDNDNDNQTIS